MKPIEYYRVHPDDPDAPESIKNAARLHAENKQQQRREALKSARLKWLADNAVAILALVIAIIALLKP